MGAIRSEVDRELDERRLQFLLALERRLTEEQASPTVLDAVRKMLAETQRRARTSEAEA